MKIRFCAVVSLALFCCQRSPMKASGIDEPANSDPATPAVSSAPIASNTSGSTSHPPARAKDADTAHHAFGFDADAPDSAPRGFSFARTGEGRLGRWVVRADATAPSAPHILAQTDADKTNHRFPIAIAEEPIARDVRVAVRCKLISGRVDQACGIVVRYADESNYYITRANALENNIRLYSVKNGKREQLASFAGVVEPGVWHSYVLEIRGDRIEVYWDGKKVLEHRDTKFASAGRCGLWTKADSVSEFDDLVIDVL